MVALPGNGVSGVNVTVAPLTTYVPANAGPDEITTLDGVTVNGFTALLKVSTTALVTATPVALFNGLTEVTAGAVLSGVADADVVNPLVNEVAALPATSVNPPTVTW
jgi:hypothetical protein